VLGTGWIADQFVGSLRAHTAQVVQAVGSRSQSSADKAAARWGVGTAYASYEALVADPSVDIVYVATPHNFHLPHALLAIDAGKHVLVEKPVGLDAAEACAIGDAAAAAGVFCMEAMWTLFLPKFDVVRQVLADGWIGAPTTVVCDMGEWFGPDHRILRADLAGGPLLDLGTYPVTLATWVLGAPDAVAAVATPAPNGVNGQLSIALATPGGGTAALQCSVIADTVEAACVAGPDGRIDIGRFHYRPGPLSVHLRSGGSLHWDEPAVDHEALHFEAAEVARSITAGQTASPLRPWSETVATLEVMDRVRAATGLDFAQALAARERAEGVGRVEQVEQR
jgi:predicted dehydrogenase